MDTLTWDPFHSSQEFLLFLLFSKGPSPLEVPSPYQTIQFSGQENRGSLYHSPRVVERVRVPEVIPSGHRSPLSLDPVE